MEYHPLANIHDVGPVEFIISGDGEDYIDLSASHLHVEAKIRKSDGSSLCDQEPVAKVNLFLQALFS